MKLTKTSAAVFHRGTRANKNPTTVTTMAVNVVAQYVVMFREPGSGWLDPRSLHSGTIPIPSDWLLPPAPPPRARAVSIRSRRRAPSSPEMCDRAHSSTITSSPSSLSGYTATFAEELCPTSPVFGSYCQPCHGQITFPIFDHTLSQRPAAVQANVVHGGAGTFAVRDANRLFAHGKLARLAIRRQLRDRRDPYECRHKIL